jgi:hypothetical protein
MFAEKVSSQRTQSEPILNISPFLLVLVHRCVSKLLPPFPDRSFTPNIHQSLDIAILVHGLHEIIDSGVLSYYIFFTVSLVRLRDVCVCVSTSQRLMIGTEDLAIKGFLLGVVGRPCSEEMRTPALLNSLVWLKAIQKGPDLL